MEFVRCTMIGSPQISMGKLNLCLATNAPPPFPAPRMAVALRTLRPSTTSGTLSPHIFPFPFHGHYKPSPPPGYMLDNYNCLLPPICTTLPRIQHPLMSISLYPEHQKTCPQKTAPLSSTGISALVAPVSTAGLISISCPSSYPRLVCYRGLATVTH